MSDEEDETSPEEGFSASEDEWKPSKEMQKRGGESSDDDDSDFEDLPILGGAGSNSGSGIGKRREPKGRSAIKQQAVKKRKSTGQSLRSKLYNKYKPPPKTFPTRSDSNSPSASTSTSKVQKKASKNFKTPNDGSDNDNDDDNNSDSSDSSVDNYLVNPAELDLRSSFFDVSKKKAIDGDAAAPQFDCNAGMNLSNSDSEDNETSGDDEEKTTAAAAASKAFDFRNLLENATSLERAKEIIAKRAAISEEKRKSQHDAADAMDVESLLALGENQAVNLEADDSAKGGRQKLRQTKSTRQKRHTKTRPTSTVIAAADDSEDSDFEEVADYNSEDVAGGSLKHNNNETLEIHVELTTKQRKKTRDQQDLENALKRKLNRDIKERQLLLHKASLLCFFARSYSYNRFLNDTALMQDAVKLLPSKNAYPTEHGTELKYYQSLVTWFKTTIKLKSEKLYAEKNPKNKDKIKLQLRENFKKKEARCKQDMVCMFIILVRGMGLQCRLVVNMQPLPLRPSQSDLCTIKLKKDDKEDDKTSTKEADKNKKHKSESDSKEKAKKSTEQKDNSNKGKEKEKAKKSAEHKENLNDSKENKQAKKDTTENKDRSTENSNSGASKLKGNVNKLRETKSNETTKIAAVEKFKKSAEKQKANPIKEVKVDTKIDSKKTESTTTSSNVASDKREVLKSTTKPTQTKLKRNQNTDQAIATKKSKFDEVAGPTPVARRTRLASKDQPAQKRTTSEPRQPQKSIIEIVINADAVTATSTEQQHKEAFVKPATKTTKSKLNEVAPTPVARRTRQASKDQPAQKRTTSEPRQLKSFIDIVINADAVSATSADQQQHKEPFAKPAPETAKPKPKSTKNTEASSNKPAGATKSTRSKRSSSVSPKSYVVPNFLQDNKVFKEKFSKNVEEQQQKAVGQERTRSKSPKDKNEKIRISTEFLKEPPTQITRALRTRQKSPNQDVNKLKIPQLDGTDDLDDVPLKERQSRPKLKKLQKSRSKEDSSDSEHFQPSPPKRPKTAPVLSKAVAQLRKDRRVLSTDDEIMNKNDASKSRNVNAADMWIEVWSDVEEQWICVDLFKGKLHSVDAIRKAATSSFAYVYAFQNDLSIKDITARYCPNWTTTIRKSRVEKAWLDEAISAYLGRRTKRDIREDQELRRIHEEKPMPTAISEYKDHPLYALERHLLKFQAIYPPEPPTLGFVRGEPVYARECVHTLHSREIWLKSARTVKLGEQPYKIVKARPKWDRMTQTVIKDQPLEIFGYWQTQDYEPPTAENGLVPRNAYGNVELFKACMLPKKTVHLRLNGLNRVCKKLGIDCASAVIGFDFHQGSCHPLYDGFIICEEFEETVTAAWHEDQENQVRKENEKYEARVYGNWKKLIRGLLIRERLKRKYNF